MVDEPSTSAADPVSSSRGIGRAILQFVTHIPASPLGESVEPLRAARQQANLSAARAALTAGTLSLPPGPMGWLTLVPEMVGVWRIQAQLVSDIARIYGHHAQPRQEQMLYCLFKHSSAQAVRDLVVRIGGRYLVKEASLSALQRIAAQVGLRVTQKTLARAAGRWLPVVGAVSMGGYAYYDTRQVANTAIGLFGPGDEVAYGRDAIEPENLS